MEEVQDSIQFASNYRFSLSRCIQMCSRSAHKWVRKIYQFSSLAVILKSIWQIVHSRWDWIIIFQQISRGVIDFFSLAELHNINNGEEEEEFLRSFAVVVQWLSSSSQFSFPFSPAVAAIVKNPNLWRN
jgi:hypothetical protein